MSTPGFWAVAGYPLAGVVWKVSQSLAPARVRGAKQTSRVRTRRTASAPALWRNGSSGWSSTGSKLPLVGQGRGQARVGRGVAGGGAEEVPERRPQPLPLRGARRLANCSP